MRPNRPQPLARSLCTYGRSRAQRWHAYDYRADAVVHVTICATCSEALIDHAFRSDICRDVEFYCDRLGYRLFGYCLMPDHLHVLPSPNDSAHSLDVWLQRFKSWTAHCFAKRGGAPPLWQRSAHDHVCRDGETAEAVLRYIVDNPVRAGLVTCWKDWAWTRVFIEI